MNPTQSPSQTTSPSPTPKGRAPDWRAAIDAADLPGPIAGLIHATVRRSRLWRREKADLARELAAHFTDALNAGVTQEHAMQEFGNPSAAARLIRRAKKRNRPLIYRAFIHTCQGLVMLILALGLAYLVLAWRFFTGEPTLSRNFTAEHNETIESIPQEDRAWDLYADARALSPGHRRPDISEWPQIHPDHPQYAEAVTHLEGFRESLELVHRAASLPRLGATMQTEVDPRYAAPNAAPDQIVDAWGPIDDPENPMVIGVLFPELVHMRLMAQLLTFEVHHAATEGDSRRVNRALHTMVGMAEHAADRPVVISSLVGLAIYELAILTAGDTIAKHPHLFSDAQLQALAHRFAGFMEGDIHVNLEGERWMFEDTLQRTFTDDGNGNGHLTAAGLRTLMATQSLTGDDRVSRSVGGLLGPASLVLVADRAEMQNKFDEIFAMVERRADAPMWEYESLPSPSQAIETLAANPLNAARYLPVVLLTPALDRAALNAERAVHRRDGVLTGIALEMHLRDTGAHPESLDALIPRYIPARPVDRFTGKPLRYRNTDDGPLLWSVGVDRKDDGGVEPDHKRPQAWNWLPAAEAQRRLESGDRAIDGDLVLWPIEIELAKESEMLNSSASTPAQP